MAKWNFARSLVGAGEKLSTVMAGSGGFTAGDPLIADGSGGYTVAAAVTAVPRYVAASAAVSGAEGLAYPCLPTSLFRATMTGAGVVGGQYDLTTTNTINTSGTTTKAVEVVDVDEADSTIAYVISRGWLA